jgi:pilus assembly protein CpaD
MIRDHHAAAARQRSRRLLVRAALLVGGCALIAGCTAKTTHEDIMATGPADYRQRHPIVVKEKDHTVELFVGNSRGGLTPDQRADVLAFARTWKREATGGIVIEVPVRTPNAAAARGATHEAQALLQAAGVPPNGVVLRSYRVGSPTQLATVRLSYPRMMGEAGPCGMWPGDLGPPEKAYIQNKPYWNFGCAVQRNMAAMVANPADLVQPRGEDPAYQMRRTFMMEQYRKGMPTGTKDPSTEAAKISEVGK